jgi:histidinol-phosphate/aromatic aminotransferase/cobyric acid decarboxylase-like protein
VATGLLRRGLVPRTFAPGHPLEDHLRVTVRDTDDNDRLVAAAREIAASIPTGARS